MARAVTEAEAIQRSLLFTMLGLVVEVFCVWEVGVLGTVAFVLVGIPLMLLGIGMFLRMVWRVLRKTGSV